MNTELAFKRLYIPS